MHVMRLKWEQVDFEFGIVHPDPEHSKIKKCGSAPMDSMLRKILTIQKQRWERSGKRCDWVFPNENGTDRNKDFRKAWQSACERAGIGKRHFHDLRRTAVRDMVRSGIDQTVVMKISGHQTRSIFDRYNIVNNDDLTDAARKRDAHEKERKRNRQKRGFRRKF